MTNSKLASFLLIALVSMPMLSCSTPRLESQAELEVFGSRLSDSEYEDIIRRNTREAKGYTGLHNVFHFHVLLKTQEVIRAIARRKALYYQWSADELREYLESEIQSTASRARLFLSFYTPERAHDDLNSGDSMWRLYLTNSGKRYEGKARKLADPFAQVASVYPFHGTFSTAYEVEFLIPSTQLALSETVFTLTGNLGAAKVALSK